MSPNRRNRTSVVLLPLSSSPVPQRRMWPSIEETAKTKRCAQNVRNKGKVDTELPQERFALSNRVWWETFTCAIAINAAAYNTKAVFLR